MKWKEQNIKRQRSESVSCSLFPIKHNAGHCSPIASAIWVLEPVWLLWQCWEQDRSGVPLACSTVPVGWQCKSNMGAKAGWHQPCLFPYLGHWWTQKHSIYIVRVTPACTSSILELCSLSLKGAQDWHIFIFQWQIRCLMSRKNYVVLSETMDIEYRMLSPKSLP